jgi:hypothetical protein
LRDTSSAALRLVPATSMKVVGAEWSWSVSFEAIHVKRGESFSGCFSRPALTKCQRSRESAVAQPTHEPLPPWSPIFHHRSRRSFEAGTAARSVARRPARAACSKRQSRSVSRDGTTFRIRLTDLAIST